MEVRRRKNEDFEIDSVNCRVVNNIGEVIDNTPGNISGNEVYYFLDSTREEFVADKVYTVCFEVEIVGLPKIIIANTKVKINKRSC